MVTCRYLGFLILSIFFFMYRS